MVVLRLGPEIDSMRTKKEQAPDKVHPTKGNSYWTLGSAISWGPSDIHSTRNPGVRNLLRRPHTVH
jgi:hypothetical protein